MRNDATLFSLILCLSHYYRFFFTIIIVFFLKKISFLNFFFGPSCLLNIDISHAQKVFEASSILRTVFILSGKRQGLQRTSLSSCWGSDISLILVYTGAYRSCFDSFHFVLLSCFLSHPFVEFGQSGRFLFLFLFFFSLFLCCSRHFIPHRYRQRPHLLPIY